MWFARLTFALFSLLFESAETREKRREEARRRWIRAVGAKSIEKMLEKPPITTPNESGGNWVETYTYGPGDPGPQLQGTSSPGNVQEDEPLVLQGEWDSEYRRWTFPTTVV